MTPRRLAYLPQGQPWREDARAFGLAVFGHAQPVRGRRKSYPVKGKGQTKTREHPAQDMNDYQLSALTVGIVRSVRIEGLDTPRNSTAKIT